MDYSLLNVTRSSYVFPDKPRILPVFPIYIAPKIIRRYTGLRKTPIITSAVRYRNEQRKTYLWNPQFLDNTKIDKDGIEQIRKTEKHNRSVQELKVDSVTAKQRAFLFQIGSNKMSPTPQRLGLPGWSSCVFAYSPS
jgi:hypothetical protein